MAHTLKDDEAIRVTLRMPADTHARIVESAKASGRSMNAELLHLIEQSFALEREDITEALAMTAATEARLNETQAILAEGQKRLARMEAMIDSLVKSSR